MINGVGVVLNLTQQEATDLLTLIDHTPITGAQALAVVLLRQKIEQAIKSYAEMAIASERANANGSEPAPEVAPEAVSAQECG